MKRNQLLLLLTLVLFVAMVTLYFGPHGNLRYCLAYPAAVLTLGSLFVSPWPLTLALLACTVGDVMGILGSLSGQMGGFAVAHVFFIVLLRRGIVHQHLCLRLWVSVAAIELVSWIVIGCLVAPTIPSVPLKIGCMAYAALLLTVFGLAVIAALARRQAGKAMSVSVASMLAAVAVVGAGLFVFSDFVLAWNLFVEQVSHARYYIMCTYYAALLLLFIALRREE